MRLELLATTRLRFSDGAPVRAASALARLPGGWLVASDDAVDAAWWSGAEVQRVRLLDPVDGHAVFGPSAGTKHLKPDLEAAVAVDLPEGPAALLLGSGSLPNRTTGVLARPGPDGWAVRSADLGPLYAQVAAALGLAPGQLNLEGACVHDGVLRWFARAAPSASVELDLGALLDVVRGAAPADAVQVRARGPVDLGDVGGVPLAVTDAVALPDGRVLVSAAAEDTPDPVADGPVTGSALVLLDGDDVVALAPLPPLAGRAAKVEGLAVAGRGTALDVLAVVDDDDEGAPSPALLLRLTGVS